MAGVFTILLTEAVATNAAIAIQPFVLFKRLVLVHFYKSKGKLCQLLMPPRMKLGELYAASIKTMSLGLIYAPLHPLLYLITAIALCITYWSVRFALVFWFRRPAALDLKIANSARMAASGLVGFSIVVSEFLLHFSAEDGIMPAWLLWSLPFAWLLYLVAPMGRLPCLALNDEMTCLQSDTDGVRFDEVVKKKKYEVAHFKCPVPAADMLRRMALVSEVAGIAQDQELCGAASCIDEKIRKMRGCVQYCANPKQMASTLTPPWCGPSKF